LGTIDALAAGTLSYDVVNQEGTNPVWMTIEIDTGVVGNRSDDTTYQHVPTTNPAGWHTVDAAAGLWQKWNNYEGDTTGNPKISLSAVAANHTGLNVTRVYLRLGMGDSYHGTGNGTVAWVDKVTIGTVTYDFVLPRYWYVAKTGLDSNEGTLASPFLTIQKAVDSASAGDTIHVAAGTYVQTGQIIIAKNLTIIGADRDTTIIKRGPSFSGSYFFRVNAGTFNLSNVTLDGDGNLYGGVRYGNPGTGTVSNNIFKNIVAPSYTGFGVVVYANNVSVSNNIFTNIGRVGIWVGGNNALVTGNNYTGKGAIDCLDYGIEVGYGGVVTITGNTITNCKGVASTDNSTSAGILVTTYYGAGTMATITGNTLTSNTGGIGVGYDEYDTSTVVAHYNSINGNTDYGIDTTAPTVDATANWWGDASGPYHATTNPLATGNSVSDNVDYSPWWGANYVGVAHPWSWYTNDSIQDAVDAASAGDTVNVVAGTYDEQVVITKSLTLQGAGNTTIIQPSSAATLTQVFTGLIWSGGTKNIAGIIVASVAGGSPVTIKNLKVDESLVTTKPAGADYLAGIFYRETGGLVDTVTVAGTGAWCSGDRAFGMYLSAGANTVSVEVKGSTITNFDKEGINAEGNTLTVNIHHNTITGRGPTLVGDEVQNGVDIGRDAVATVNYNTISNLEYGPKTWWAAGILVYHYVTPTGKSATANNNNITNCQIGIMFKNANATAQDNIVSGGTVGLAGIHAQPNYVGTYTASFVGNTVSGITGSSAIDAETFASASPGNWATLTATISNNILTGGYGTADGIYVGGSGGSVTATISGNTISGCPEHGINLGDACVAGATITGNTIINNAMSGLYIGAAVNATNVSANFNNIVGNTLYGANNAGTGTLNATYNWWGSSSGPYHATNPSGTGDAVSDYVDFEPWLLVENPTVTTQAATSITNNSTTLNMNFTVGGYDSVNVRFAYKKSTDTTWTNTTWMPKTANGTHPASLTGLSSNTQYNFTAQLKYNDVEFGETTLEGATRQFTTLPTPPTVTTQAATSIYPTSTIPILNMNFTVGGYGSVNVRFAYKKSADSTWSYTGWVSKGADGAYFKRLGLLFMLAPSTQYDFKAQLQYDDTVIEGATLHFTTAVSGCFIATAAYGTPTAKQIDVLRAFRDEVLLKNAVGSQFVALYYRFSPPIANVIAGNELLRTLVRQLLVDPIVHVVQATGDMWRN
jgi:hypothetical protein